MSKKKLLSVELSPSNYDYQSKEVIVNTDNSKKAEVKQIIHISLKNKGRKLF